LAKDLKRCRQILVSTPLAYEQRNLNGTLCFVLYGKGSYRGKEFYSQQPFLKLPDGTIRPGPPTISKMDCHTTETMSLLVMRSNGSLQTLSFYYLGPPNFSNSTVGFIVCRKHRTRVCSLPRAWLARRRPNTAFPVRGASGGLPTNNLQNH